MNYNQQITTDLYIDELSRLHNRRYLKEKQEMEIKKLIVKDISFSVVMVDIDHFKEINDNYGHLKGDEVIKEFARFLKNTLRTTDTLIRYGGDEFICIMPNTQRPDAEWIYSRILKSCKEKELGGLRITISVGISSYPNDGRDFEELLKLADKSLYDAKRSGRDRIGAIRKKSIEIPMKVFIDRFEEKECLRRLLIDDKKMIKGGIVKGNVGIGKTRLVKDILNNDVRKRGIVWADCLSFAENIAYYPIREIVKYKIKRHGEGILRNIPLAYKLEIGKLMPDVIVGAKGRGDIESVLDRYRLYESVRMVIELGELAKVIIVDNMQWVDEGSTEVMKYLMRSLRDKDITFIFIYREEEKTKLLEDFISSISRENEVVETELRPFGNNEIKASIKAIIGEETESGLLEYVVRESGGNPFYIEEIMKGLYEAGYLTTKEDYWRFWGGGAEGRSGYSTEEIS